MTDLRAVTDQEDQLPIRIYKGWEGHNGQYWYWSVGTDNSVIGYLDKAVCERYAEQYREKRLAQMRPDEDEDE